MSKALMVDVYTDKYGGDCTNGGVSSRFKHVLVPCECENSWDCGPIDYDPANPPENMCYIERRELFGQVILTLVPAHGKGWHMYGGNKADTSDARWGKMLERVSGNPFYRFNTCIDIHDRYE